MKNYNSLFSISLLILIISISAVTKVSATVGGETLIYDFKYNPVDESVYYMNADGGGRGCLPNLLKISLNSEKTNVALDGCQFSIDNLQEVQKVEIDKITKNFKPLIPLNLKTNTVSVDVNFVKAEKYSPESDEIMMRHFIASLYQNGKKVKEFPLTGCNLDQPFTFQGYSIPGFNKKIVVLVSAVSNCGEGGYIAESLQIIGGVDNLNKTQTGNFYKGAFPLSPNEGNLVVYQSDKTTVVKESTIVEPVVKEIVSTSTPMVVEKSIKESFFTKFVSWFKNLF